MSGPISAAKHPRAYCLDAQLSYRVARALEIVGWDIVHVSDVDELRVPDTVTGQSQAKDELIAPWCVANQRVLITTDEDFRGRWVRSGLLSKHGLEVIVFEKEIAGLREQHARITLHLPFWEARLGAKPYRHCVWTQGARREPKDIGRYRP